ncbi:flagellar hook-basal body complex protein FliE [Candidatus Sodalis endolongispinus]|uniref:Flagellar hook-basal body complex protein FliE n=1 Tax=Candidatus Sodalis endolongispinus TaxID=2812662 RepID=A0ABS5Y8B4_9GAMM|nr:flagellar hook-basal body complex protein FliE [Candidatus Sodalis endolongispinus]
MAQLTATARAADSMISHDAAGKSAGFAQQLGAALDKISDTQIQANRDSQAYSSGETDLQLNDVMIDLQKSSLSLQMILPRHLRTAFVS